MKDNDIFGVVITIACLIWMFNFYSKEKQYRELQKDYTETANDLITSMNQTTKAIELAYSYKKKSDSLEIKLRNYESNKTK